MKSNLDKVLFSLERRGITPLKIESSRQDPTIWITESIYLQVGKKSVVIFNDKLNKLSIYESSFRVRDIIEQLQRALNG